MVWARINLETGGRERRGIDGEIDGVSFHALNGFWLGLDKLWKLLVAAVGSPSPPPIISLSASSPQRLSFLGGGLGWMRANLPDLSRCGS